MVFLNACLLELLQEHLQVRPVFQQRSVFSDSLLVKKRAQDWCEEMQGLARYETQRFVHFTEEYGRRNQAKALNNTYCIIEQFLSPVISNVERVSVLVICQL